MESRSSQKIPSGIEPADRLLGGLTSGELYLVHGEASSQSLFAIKFLIEGLKRGESGAIVIRYTPEEAVRRIAQLGYDCLEDVYSGRLVILEYSDDIIQQIAHLRELTPVLRELEWLLGETHPRRLVFDPVTSVVVGREIDLETRVNEFAGWARSFGATVVMIASDEDERVPRMFHPLVAESFRFDVRDGDPPQARFLAFEKSTRIPDQPVEVDPTRGIFLLGGNDSLNASFAAEPLNGPVVPADSLRFEAVADGPGPNGVHELKPVENPAAAPDVFDELFDDLEAPSVVAEPDAADQQSNDIEETVNALGASDSTAAHEQATPVVPDKNKTEQVQPADFDPAAAGSQKRSRRSRAADSKIDSSIAARAAEILLKAPIPREEPPPVAATTAAAVAGLRAQRVDPKDFNVLIIDADQVSSKAMADTLSHYTVEVVHDGISGLSKLISFKPDLIVLDVDLPVIDGFKVLEHIRQSLNLPIIIVSGSHVRASDRVLSSELGADYYLTRPFSSKELRHKAKQLIARYRGIVSWIVNPQAGAEANDPAAGRAPAQAASSPSEPHDNFLSYEAFSAEVQRRVGLVMESGDSFSIVGCSVPDMTAQRGRLAIRLYELVRSLARETDLSSTNPNNELVVLLEDADASGARAFASRLRDRVKKELNQEVSIWMRTFPEPEASIEEPSQSTRRSRRADDDQIAKDPGPQPDNPASSPSHANARSASVGSRFSEHDGR